MKPRLIDYSLFIPDKGLPNKGLPNKGLPNKGLPKSNIIKETFNKNNDISFLINIIIFLMLFIGGYLLYKRYKNKDDNKKMYIKKIENLYNTINKYNG